MNMNDKLKEIFHQIQAEEELKSATKMYLKRKTQGYTRARTKKLQYMAYAAACVCFLIMVFGGRWLYFTPTAEISIDINPSIELSINRFDQVISVNSFNEDGQELLKALNVKFKNYEDAMEQILDNDKIITLLSNDEVMTITVTGPDGLQSSKLLSGVESCTAKQRNTYCYFASEEKVAEAHKLGLSYGKYRAYLELQLLDPNITPETIQGMTMREIRELINELAAERGDDTPIYENPGNGNHGNGNCYGNGHGRGRQNGKKRKNACK